MNLLSSLIAGFKEFISRPKAEEKKEILLEEDIEEIHTVWDYLKFQENTQAFHISSVIGFEEWISMEEMRRRIKDVFGIDYLNNRSLYAYIKTMGDIGLFEIINTGGKRRWRKRELLIRIKAGKKRVKEEETNKEHLRLSVS